MTLRSSLLSFLTFLGTSFHFFIDELFRVAMLTYLFLLLLEGMQAGFVSAYFNLTILFFLVLAAGVISAILGRPAGTAVTAQPGRRRDVVITAVLALLSGLVIYLQITPFGKAAWFIAALASLLIFGLSYVFVLKESVGDD